MHDTVIRGGTIVNGTGQPAYTGNLALNGDKIAQVGGKASPGKREIDANGLRLHIPEVRYDLPMNDRRLLQRVDGYRNTFMSGVSTFENGVYTGATPGRLVRASAA